MTHYIIRGTVIAERPFARPPLSFAFFCATCGEVWGRVATEGQPWKVHEVPCESHLPVGVWDWGKIPGSMIAYVVEVGLLNASLCLDLLPPVVLARELIIHCNYYEEKNNERSLASNPT